MILEKEVIFIQKLAYSFHIGNDKNRSKRSRKNIKNGVVVDKVFNNNAIQNAQQLSRVNKHNLRKYDNNIEKIELLYGSNDLYEDVKKLYVEEFDAARLVYNEKQIRNDRKIEDYFSHISNNDKNKVFSACFPTPVTNDKGIPHIIEHSLLCGSKKYPLVPIR